MTRPTFSDEDLTSYLDGEADGALVSAMDAALPGDEGLQARLDTLRPLGDHIGAAGAGLLALAPEMPVPPEPAKARWSNLTTAALAACLAVGIGIGALMTKWSAEPDWMDYVAAYQALYVSETLTSVETTPEQQASQLQALSTVLGTNVAAAKDDDVLAFRRGQLLGYQGRALVQLAYLAPDGAPVALCVIRASDNAVRAVQTATLESMAAAHWTRDGYAYLLIGGQDSDLIAAAAQRMAAKL